MEQRTPRVSYYPFILAAAIVLIDQITKALIVARVPLYYNSGVTIEVIGDFFRIIHARNLGVAFSLGDSLPFWLRKTLFVGMPVGVLLLLVVTFYRSDENLPRPALVSRGDRRGRGGKHHRSHLSPLGRG